MLKAKVKMRDIRERKQCADNKSKYLIFALPPRYQVACIRVVAIVTHNRYYDILTIVDFWLGRANQGHDYARYSSADW